MYCQSDPIGSDRIRLSPPTSPPERPPKRTQADSGGPQKSPPSPPESASADLLADWLADPIGSDRIRSGPIGSAADPPRTKSADYSPANVIRD